MNLRKERELRFGRFIWMIVSIASGKGGTGKTSVAVNMALSLGDVQLLDCDVEEPNAHILLQPEITESKPVYKLIPHIKEDRCDYCGRCSEFCKYHAIFVVEKNIMVFPELCHSCGGCSIVCPRNAIVEEEKQIGTIKKGIGRNINIVYGELNVGEPMAVPLIRAVRKEIRNDETVLIDVPPGTACPLVASIHKSDYCILVTEPTPFGLHDLKITVEVVRELKIPLGVIINRAGIGDTQVHEYCKNESIPLLLEIPFSRKIAELYSRGIPFVSEMPEWKMKFQQLFDKVRT